MKTIATHIIFLIPATALIAVTAVAQPVFGSSFMLDDQKIFPDKKKSNLYYYIPPDYKLLTDAGGKPSFSLLKMRYTGTTATGDAGVIKYSNLLQFKVGVDMMQQKKMTDTKAALRNKYPGSELRILPIRKFFSLLVFTPAAPEAGADTVSTVKADLAEPSDDNTAVSNSYWNARTVTIRLSNIDAQLVESALKSGQSIMSFSYAFYSVFAEKTDLRTEVYGNNPALREEVKSIFNKEMYGNADTTVFITPVKANAFPLSVDIQRWRNLVQEVDINERMPAKFPLFDVYCYDFSQGLRADLYQKKIEIRATGVSGAEILYSFSFGEDRPEIYARSIRFAYAVRFDKPFFYRVTETDHNGDQLVTDWKQKTAWSELLDITTPADKVVLKTKPPDTEQ